MNMPAVFGTIHQCKRVLLVGARTNSCDEHSDGLSNMVPEHQSLRRSALVKDLFGKKNGNYSLLSYECGWNLFSLAEQT